MKIFFIITLCLFFVSCDNPFKRDNDEKETIQKEELKNVSDIKKFYCQEFDDSLFQSHRCDKITFKGLMVAFCNKDSINGHEDGNGKWTRWDLNTDKPCYKDGVDLGSRSECSGDGYISTTHVWLTQGANVSRPQSARSVQYLEDNSWICGEGFKGYTSVKKLKWLLLTVRDHLEGKSKPTPADVAAAMAASGLVDLGDLLKEFNKYLVAIHAYSFGRMRHSFSDKTMDVLEDLVDSSPESMIFQALYHRYLDGNQEKALSLIKKNCPTDYLPTDVDYGGWGSSLLAMHCVVSISILEGM